MRVTDRMIRENILFDVQSTLQRISKYHLELSSGRKVRYPSDDAVIATRASNINSRMRELEQYKRNVDHVSNIVNSYDTISQEISSIYQRLRELLVRAANDTLSGDERRAIADEIEEIGEHLAEIGRTRVGGEYIFGGVRTDKPPVEKIDGKWKITLPPRSDERRSVNVFGMTFEYGLTAWDIFKTGTGESVFEILRNVVDKLRNEQNSTSYISNVAIKNVSYLERKTMESFARIGAISRTLELVGKRINDLNLFLTEYLSKEQDADLAEVTTKLAMQNAVLEAALKSASMVLGKTLVDFV